MNTSGLLSPRHARSAHWFATMLAKIREPKIRNYEVDRALGLLRTAVSKLEGLFPEVTDRGVQIRGLMEQYYDHYTMRKRGGGVRHIITTKRSEYGNPLEKAHEAIDYFLRVIEPHPCVFSYRQNYSIANCAEKHTGNRVVVGIDLKDYFYSINERVVASLIAAVAYSMQFTADRLYSIKDGVLRAEKEIPSSWKKELSTLDGEYPLSLVSHGIATLMTVPSPIHKSEYALPIGIVPSPMVANLTLLPLDVKLTEYCSARGITYTRYCDNLYFSSQERIQDTTIEIIQFLIENYHTFGRFLKVNRKKTRVMPYYRRQRVLGVVVNKHTNVTRERHKNVRSMMHHLYHDLRQAKSLNVGLLKRYRELIGELSFLKVVNPTLYNKYRYKKLALQIIVAWLRRGT